MDYQRGGRETIEMGLLSSRSSRNAHKDSSILQIGLRYWRSRPSKSTLVRCFKVEASNYAVVASLHKKDILNEGLEASLYGCAKLAAYERISSSHLVCP